MANPEHLAKLKEGVEAWNAWRKESRIISPDLSGSDLSEADLSGANLGGANLVRANLSRAYLHESNLNEANLRVADLRGSKLALADLSGADLVRAELGEADLRGADLGGADLSPANLSGANLSGADLRWADLTLADLVGANLSEAKFGNTSFGGTELAGATGLDSCVHGRPSFLDYLTLAKSWPLPLSFLRGCGLPDKYIEYLPSLLNQAVQFYSCFISHSTKDKDFAERIYSDLQNKGVRCWYAPEDLKIGDKFQERIEESIRVHDKLLIVLSQASVNSAWVEREVQAAREREDRSGKPVLFPIRVDDAVMETGKAWAADLRRTRQIVEFVRWKEPDAYQKAFDRLMRDLKAEGSS
jgi:hypothetical protein